eukprot:TRINITY_DN4107_c0_g1_i2.p1 TRINITY_DN4107_c0_g1~~TRINITY_DN4107_c0_g1_i2.p1  ORF type:complete len:431 (-),score=66.09 TRINITY_DN4107_c0_g1_i2:877-2169(-)
MSSHSHDSDQIEMSDIMSHNDDSVPVSEVSVMTEDISRSFYYGERDYLKRASIMTVIPKTSEKTKAQVIVKKDALKVINKKLRSKLGMRLIFVRVIMILLYMIILYGQSFPDDIGWMTHPIYNYFSDFTDTQSLDDWYGYLTEKVIPSVFINTLNNGDLIEDDIRKNLFLDQDRLISPLILLKYDSVVDDCDGIGANIYPECYDDTFPLPGIFTSFNPVETNPEDYIEFTLHNSTFYTNTNRSYYLLPSNGTASDTIELINIMKNELWATRATRLLRIVFVLYNGNENFFLKVDLNLGRRASGSVVSEIIVNPAKLEVYEDRIDIVRLVFEFILILWCGLMGYMDFYYAPNKIRKKKGHVKWINGFTFVQLIFYTGFLINIILWISFLIGFGQIDLSENGNYATDITTSNAVFVVLKTYFIYSTIAIISI